MTWVMAATPWAFWLLVGAVRGSRRAAAGLAVLLGVCAGWSVNPESAVFLWLAVAVAGVVIGLGRRRRLTLPAASFLLATAVAGVGAVPTLVNAADSPKAARMAGSGQYPSSDVTWTLRARVASMLVTPWRYGHPADRDWTQPFPAAPVSLGVGSIAVCCLLAGRPRRRVKRWAAALAAVGVLAAVLVWQLPGIGDFLGRVPVLGALVWVRAGFLVSFVLAMLAGIGVDAVLRRGHIMRFVVAAVAVQVAVAFLVLTLPNGPARRRCLESGWYPGLAGALAPLLPALGGAVLPALVLAEQCTAGAGLLPGAASPPVHGAPAIVQTLGRLVAREPGRILGMGPALPANLGARLGFSDLRSFDPVRTLPLVRLHRALGATAVDLPGPVTAPWAGLAGAWGVRWLATPPDGLHGACAAGWEEAYRDDDGRIYRNTRALPVVRLASRVSASPGDPGSGAWEGLDFSAAAVADGPLHLGGEGSIVILEDRASRHVARVQARGRVLAVLHIPRAPGWRAFVDGRRAPVVEADLAAMGVVVRDGEHEVRWQYAPPGLAVGLALTLGGLAGCLLFSPSSPGRRR